MAKPKRKRGGGRAGGRGGGKKTRVFGGTGQALGEGEGEEEEEEEVQVVGGRGGRGGGAKKKGAGPELIDDDSEEEEDDEEEEEEEEEIEVLEGGREGWMDCPICGVQVGGGDAGMDGHLRQVHEMT